jgi:hypothetical protein
MTGLATHVNVGPGRLICIRVRTVVLFQIGGVTFRAHAIPVLAGIGPVKPVFEIRGRIRNKMIPSLFSYIPGNGKALPPAAGKGDKILL